MNHLPPGDAELLRMNPIPVVGIQHEEHGVKLLVELLVICILNSVFDVGHALFEVRRQPGEMSLLSLPALTEPQCGAGIRRDEQVDISLSDLQKVACRSARSLLAAGTRLRFGRT